jgi:hypothetical protein
LQRVTEELRRYVDAIALTGDVGVLTAAVREREHQRRHIEQQLAGLAGDLFDAA